MPQMKKPVCLFMINGLGMGNSTRCYALIQKLAPMAEIHVFTSGNGVMFHKDKEEVSSITESEAYFYAAKDGGISVMGTLASTWGLYQIFKRKSRQLENLIDKLKPDVVILDSEYSVFPVRRRKIPIIALNNSDVVVNEYLARDDLPSSVRSQFWLVEFSDYQFHKTFVDMAISPSLKEDTPRSPKFHRVGAMVREPFMEIAKTSRETPFKSPRQAKRVVFMLSGSIFASNITGAFSELPYEVEVVGREGVSQGNVTYHGKVANSVDILKKADILVINGGFLAVSEAAALRKPAFVIPVPNHAEQVVNAYMLRDTGIGYVTSESTVIGQLKELYEKDRWEGLKDEPLQVNFNGSVQAAEAVMSFLKGR